MGKAGHERARLHFPIEKMVGLNEELYERLLAGRISRPA